MLVEIEFAANFLSDLLRNNCLDSCLLEQFRQTLIDYLHNDYQKHWFPDQPFKGSAYRCLRINHKMDPMLSRAGQKCGLQVQQLRQLFPSELTLWIDPKEVSYRIGENGSICVIYEDCERPLTPSTNSSMSSSCSSSPSMGNGWDNRSVARLHSAAKQFYSFTLS